MTHICLVCLEKSVFEDIKSQTAHLGPIFWGDFSQNICNTPKHETQSHHYGAKQTSLFCTVKIADSDPLKYIYHLCDSTAHDINIVGKVIDELYDQHFDGVMFHTKTDNCPCQFKCLWTFVYWLYFARKHNIKVISYYGVAGHGKGLVDSMSSFGVKNLIRKAIITDDYWYDNANDLVTHLKSDFMVMKTSIIMYLTLMKEKVTSKYSLLSPIIGSNSITMILYQPD